VVKAELTAPMIGFAIAPTISGAMTHAPAASSRAADILSKKIVNGLVAPLTPIPSCMPSFNGSNTDVSRTDVAPDVSTPPVIILHPLPIASPSNPARRPDINQTLRARVGIPAASTHFPVQSNSVDSPALSFG